MAYEFKLPDLGEGLTEGEIARWLVQEGQEIAEDDPLVEIQTDKTTVEIPSPAAGKVSRILAQEGQVVPVGTVIVVIGGDGVAPIEEPPQAERARATPLVRKIAQELGVDLEAVTSTGAGGRITEEDVRGAAGPSAAAEGRREPIRGVRRLMSENMARSHREIPAVTWVEECDFEHVELTQLVPLVLRAVAESLREYPELNARIEGDELVYLDRYDIGIAVATDEDPNPWIAIAEEPGEGRDDRCQEPANEPERPDREGAVFPEGVDRQGNDVGPAADARAGPRELEPPEPAVREDPGEGPQRLAHGPSIAIRPADGKIRGGRYDRRTPSCGRPSRTERRAAVEERERLTRDPEAEAQKSESEEDVEAHRKAFKRDEGAEPAADDEDVELHRKLTR
jgi:hypothetical protein